MTRLNSLLLILLTTMVTSFIMPSPSVRTQRHSMSQKQLLLFQTTNSEDGVVELGDDDGDDVKQQQQQVAPFLSQGEIADDVLNPDLSDPKQARVIIYIIISLIPVLFLVPLMLGSRDLIPLEVLPPVEL